MRNESYVFAATIAVATVIGCGGSASHPTKSANGGASGATTGFTNSLTNLAPTGFIEVSYLTGAGRAPSDGTVARVSAADFVDDQGNTIQADVGSELALDPSQFGGPETLRTRVQFGRSTAANAPDTDPNSRVFKQFALNLVSIDSTTNSILSVIPADKIYFVSPSVHGQDSNGIMQNDINAVDLGTATFAPAGYPAHVRAFPGRVSTITVRLDPNVIGVNQIAAVNPVPDPITGQPNPFGPGNPRGVFEDQGFRDINLTADNNFVLQGLLSDYLTFNLSAMASGQPVLPNADPTNPASPKAQRVYFSGDNFAESDAVNTGNFFELTKNVGDPSSPTPNRLSSLPGNFSTNGSVNGFIGIAPPGGSATLPGTYSLRVTDPSDVSFLRKLVSLQGMFREWSDIVNTSTGTVAITFPNSGDNAIQDLVIIRTIPGTSTIKDMYFGFIDMEARQVFAYPIANLTYAQVTNEHLGTLNAGALFSASGAVTADPHSVRSGILNLTTPITFSDGSTYSGGNFIVFRR